MCIPVAALNLNVGEKKLFSIIRAVIVEMYQQLRGAWGYPHLRRHPTRP